MPASPSIAPPRRLAAPLLALLLAGCALEPPPPLPERIAAPPAGDLQLVEARQDPDAHLGAAVRWGGTVVAVDPETDGSVRVQVLERRLDGTGRPLPGSPTDGRFVIRATPDVDPRLYARGGDLTVAGRLEAAVESQVGDRSTRLPVVRVEAYVLWEPRWRHDPWYPHGHYPPWYGPRVHFGVGVGHHHRPFGHHHGWW